MDGLFLLVLAFGILAGTSSFTAFMYFRRGQLGAVTHWLNRAGWYFVLMWLGIVAGVLSYSGLVSRFVAGTYYFFLLLNFWVAAGIGRSIAQIPGPRFGRLTAFILQAVVFLLGGLVCYCVSIVAEGLFRVSLVAQGITWLLGFCLGLKPAIQRYRMARAINRLRMEEQTARFMGE